MTTRKHRNVPLIQLEINRKKTNRENREKNRAENPTLYLKNRHQTKQKRKERMKRENWTFYINKNRYKTEKGEEREREREKTGLSI